MCVLGRPFGIRQMARAGNERRPGPRPDRHDVQPADGPFVPHAGGPTWSIEHVEKHWCPTILGSFRTSWATASLCRSPMIVFAAEQTSTTPSTRCRSSRERIGGEALGWKPHDPARATARPTCRALEALDPADLLVMFMRRRDLPDVQLNRFKTYFDAGKPVVGVRTSVARVPELAGVRQAVLGCHYHATTATGTTRPTYHHRRRQGAPRDPILRGITLDRRGTATATLYRVTPLAERPDAAAQRQVGGRARGARRLDQHVQGRPGLLHVARGGCG